ncbi:hypothetical protein HK098_003709 [Nowakowskiella sp. JEL0407]|nr:hypothetical protein HK098_003709 [Nowakowskiella sp. JEL0407]
MSPRSTCTVSLPTALIISILFFAPLSEAHMTLGFPTARAVEFNNNSPFIDLECIMGPLTGAGKCDPKPYPCGYSSDSKITQTFTAGQVLDIQFFNQGFPLNQKPWTGRENDDQARHSGGLCEFSLSVDEGKTFYVIARYTKGCPDIFYTFKVMIPKDIPSSDHAVFAWTWLNADGERQFYMSCVDVKLIGVTNGRLDYRQEITKANLPGTPGFSQDPYYPQGDYNPIYDARANMKGPGPDSNETQQNLSGNLVEPRIDFSQQEAPEGSPSPRTYRSRTSASASPATSSSARQNQVFSSGSPTTRSKTTVTSTWIVQNRVAPTTTTTTTRRRFASPSPRRRYGWGGW